MEKIVEEGDRDRVEKGSRTETRMLHFLFKTQVLKYSEGKKKY